MSYVQRLVRIHQPFPQVAFVLQLLITAVNLSAFQSTTRALKAIRQQNRDLVAQGGVEEEGQSSHRGWRTAGK